MSKELVISATPHETRVAIVEDGQLCEIYIEREKEFALVGSLYKGRVTRVLPGMQSAFVDIGLDSDAFLYVSDFLEHLEEYDHVEPKAQPRPPQTGGEVFAPSTINGGVTAEPSVPLKPAAEASSVAAPVPAENGEATASAEAGTPIVAPTPQPVVPPVQQAHRPFEQRPDRGRGGFNDRGGRGGRNRRWGRQGGGRDRRPGRDLPPSKYASPRPFESRPPREAEPFEPPPADYQPIILPGESLAKYKDRIPAAPSAPPAEAATSAPAFHQEPPAPPTNLTVESEREQPAAGLPDSLYAPTMPGASIKEEYAELTPAAPAPVVEEFARVEPVEAAPQFAIPQVAVPQPVVPQAVAPHVAEPEIVHEEPRHEIAEASQAPVTNGASLSEEQVSALAEQLAEAKHEEAQAEAEQIVDAEESAAEPFVDAAELEDLQDALHDEHEDAADEADAEADEMHDQIMAAESSSENPEGNAGAQEGEHAEDPGGEGAAFEEHHDQEQMGGAEGTHDSAQSSQASDAQPTSARISNQQQARFQRPMRRGGNNRNRPGGGPRRGGRPNNQRPHQHPQHGHPRHEQHKRPQLISEMLKAGEEIIVQIAKEPLGKKGARITSHVALPGRYLVYMPTVDHIGVSRRIGSAEDRQRLRRVVTEAKGTFPGGFIVRTAAAEATDDEIRTDVEFLGRTWDTIRAASEQRRAPAILHRDLNLVQRILRDYLSDDYAAIWLDNEEEYSKVVEFVGRFQPKMVPRVKLYTKEAPIFEEFGIQQELDKALRPKVWLKSGGYIVINHTEALVAIDVNTGKYVGRGSTRLEDTIVKTNVEAVKEIVRQIRLRDLGGIIVVDFIDMEERRNRDKVMAALDQALVDDRAPSKALSFNEFGLVCITRKRTKQALERVLCQPCPYCTGSGMVKSIPTICYEIQVEAKKMAVDLDAPSLTLRVNPEIAKTLKTRESSLIEELEQTTRKSIIIQSDPTLHWEQYDIY
jgi:Rne/Rng family ribonuclease